MVDYKEQLGINFDLSPKQSEVLSRNADTIVRAVPGSGKTTILTLKIKKLLIEDPNIKKLCCISYTNVNVDDLRNACIKQISGNLIDKIEFLTFHKFCIQYILNPFSYLYRSNDGLRPYRNFFDYKEHGNNLCDYLIKNKIKKSEIDKIKKKESIFYNFIFNEKWIPTSNNLEQYTVIVYLNFLNDYKLIDFNLINLLSLFIVQQNRMVRRALNKSFDWVFIDEFQDVSEIQCKIIEELKKDRLSNKNELKWFLVGDPNQSIYGFAGANPRSMYDMREYFNAINNDNCEIKLDRTYRCSNGVFDYARDSYNESLSKIKNLSAIKLIENESVALYLEDLIISREIMGNGSNGKVFLRKVPSNNPEAEIISLKLNELPNYEVCCIGIDRFNSIDVYRQYKRQIDINDGENFRLYSDLYKDYEDKYGFKHFSLFINYLLLKHNFYKNRLKFVHYVNKHLYLLDQLIKEKNFNDEYSENQLVETLIDSCELLVPLINSDNLNDEFISFSQKLAISFNKFIPEQDIFPEVIENKSMEGFGDILAPDIEGFINFNQKIDIKKTSFEIKYIHKIKGLEYEQVIVQKIERLPYRSYENKTHQAILGKYYQDLTADDIYDYIQDLNKLYVMLTRSKNNLYIIVNENKLPDLINVNLAEL